MSHASNERPGWTWSYLQPNGSERSGEGLPGSVFPTQAEAEAWLGETWAELADLGVDSVTLWRDGVPVYGPMSLRGMS